MNPGPSAAGPSSELAALFPPGDYRFQMRMVRGEIRDFFGARDSSGAILPERRRLLDEAPSRYSAMRSEAVTLLAEWIELAKAAGIAGGIPSEEATAGEALRRLGGGFEPDLLFLRPQGGEFQLVAGCVCFPSSWSLEEKIGKPLSDIHSPVPGLNAQLAAPINQFLHRLAPGIAWCRENWGLSASPARNQHPSQRTPRLTAEATLEGTWLRVERQALVALPRSGGVCFGIRVESHPLTVVKADARAGEGLRRALETMPPEMADYKGIVVARERLIELLRE